MPFPLKKGIHGEVKLPSSLWVWQRHHLPNMPKLPPSAVSSDVADKRSPFRRKETIYAWITESHDLSAYTEFCRVLFARVPIRYFESLIWYNINYRKRRPTLALSLQTVLRESMQLLIKQVIEWWKLRERKERLNRKQPSWVQQIFFYTTLSLLPDHSNTSSCTCSQHNVQSWGNQWCQVCTTSEMMQLGKQHF